MDALTAITTWTKGRSSSSPGRLAREDPRSCVIGNDDLARRPQAIV